MGRAESQFTAALSSPYRVPSEGSPSRPRTKVGRRINTLSNRYPGVEQGLEQTAAYMDLSAADAGHLVVFDMREGRTWTEKIYREERQQDGTPITVWGA